MFFVAAAFVWSCEKKQAGDESILYGTWIKGNNAGDTLRFFQKDGKNVMAYNQSFNAAIPVPSDKQYFFRDGKLSFRSVAFPAEPSHVTSFRWMEVGRVFEIRGIELFSFMSSTNVYFTFRKI